MATVPRKLLTEYSRAVALLADNAQARVVYALPEIDMADVAQARDKIIELLDAVCEPYAEMAAEVSAQFYEAVRALSIPAEYTAELVTGRLEAATAGFVEAAVQDLVDGKPLDEFYRLVASRAGYETKRASDYCVMANASRDKKSKKYTRVSSGFDNCDFCLMLSSKGPVRISKVSPDMRAHIHDNCRCVLVPFFDGQTIAGYNQKQAYDDWKAALDTKAREAAERKAAKEGIEATPEMIEAEKKRILSYYENSARNARKPSK